ncbi:MAG: ABC transporter ATP-binding protein [Candidatus ainarchaeum sp.]|nr:ABC transporter ATP-binding protein [Candidatus ainarchaeum sp.]
MVKTLDKKIVVELKNAYKIYCMGSVCVNALNGVDLKITKGEFVSIMGPSGSGKSTMMHIIGALDLATSGKVYIDNIDLSTLNEDQLSIIRGKKIGFVFQDFNLIPTLTALENVMLPMLFQEDKLDDKHRENHCKGLLSLVGLGDRVHHKPSELSGGQQQRVAIARSLVNSPEIVLADEPTGALDSKSSEEIMDLLVDLNKEGKTVIIITHDKNVAKYTKRNIALKDGKIVEDKTKE